MSAPARHIRRFTQWIVSDHRDNYHEEAQEEEAAPIRHPGNDGLSVDDIENDSDNSRREFNEEISLSASSTSVSPADTQDQNVEDYKKMKENLSLSFNKAMRQALRIQRRHPKKLLCGSLALYLYGVIKRDTFGDIDFVAYEKNVIPKEYISLKCSLPNKHCLFLSAEVKEGKTIRRLKLQDLDQIIYWKTQFDRDSDKEDLQEYLDSQFIKEDEFLINL